MAYFSGVPIYTYVPLGIPVGGVPVSRNLTAPLVGQVFKDQPIHIREKQRYEHMRKHIRLIQEGDTLPNITYCMRNALGQDIETTLHKQLKGIKAVLFTVRSPFDLHADVQHLKSFDLQVNPLIALGYKIYCIATVNISVLCSWLEHNRVCYAREIHPIADRGSDVVVSTGMGEHDQVLGIVPKRIVLVVDDLKVTKVIEEDDVRDVDKTDGEKVCEILESISHS